MIVMLGGDDCIPGWGSHEPKVFSLQKMDGINSKGHSLGFRVPRYKTSTFGQTDTWEGARNALSDFRIQFQGMGVTDRGFFRYRFEKKTQIL